MKKFIKSIALLTAALTVLCLSACGGDSKDEDTSSKADTGSKGSAITVSVPDVSMPEKESSVVYEMYDDEVDATETVKIYYVESEDKIMSITDTTAFSLAGMSEDQQDMMKETMDEMFADFAKGSNISYSSTVADDKITIVIAIRDLDEADNVKALDDFELFNGFEENTTFSEFVKSLESEGYTKSK